MKFRLTHEHNLIILTLVYVNSCLKASEHHIQLWHFLICQVEETSTWKKFWNLHISSTEWTKKLKKKHTVGAKKKQKQPVSDIEESSSKGNTRTMAPKIACMHARDSFQKLSALLRNPHGILLLQEPLKVWWYLQTYKRNFQSNNLVQAPWTKGNGILPLCYEHRPIRLYNWRTEVDTG